MHGGFGLLKGQFWTWWGPRPGGWGSHRHLISQGRKSTVVVNDWLRGEYNMVGGYCGNGYQLVRWRRWLGGYRWWGWGSVGQWRLPKGVGIENTHGLHYLWSMPVEPLFGYPFLSMFFIFDFISNSRVTIMGDIRWGHFNICRRII